MENYFIGQGKVYGAVRDEDGKPAPYFFLGNCSALLLRLGAGAGRFARTGSTPSTTFAPAGAQPSFTLTAESISTANLALLLHAGVSHNAEAATTTAQITVAKGRLTPLPFINIAEVSVVTSADGNTTYSPTTDYKVNLATGSIEIPVDSTIPDGDVLLEYSRGESDTIEPYTVKQPWLALRFEGLNNANDGKPMVVDIFKTKLPPLDSFSLIGDNLSTMELAGVMHYDEEAPASTTEGRILRIQQVM